MKLIHLLIISFIFLTSSSKLIADDCYSPFNNISIDSIKEINSHLMSEIDSRNDPRVEKMAEDRYIVDISSLAEKTEDDSTSERFNKEVARILELIKADIKSSNTGKVKAVFERGDTSSGIITYKQKTPFGYKGVKIAYIVDDDEKTMTLKLSKDSGVSWSRHVEPNVYKFLDGLLSHL